MTINHKPSIKFHHLILTSPHLTSPHPHPPPPIPQAMSPPPPVGPGDSGSGTLVFIHPDLGIGGAERLIVDAAVGLQKRGHRVVIFTNRCDADHCFEECRDGTLDVRVRGNGLFPTSILDRLAIFCAVARQVHLVLQLVFSGELLRLEPRAVIVDQLSASLPLLRFFYPRVPILFYCHFPDLLLARGREGSLLKRLYRIPFDRLEQWSMAFSDAVAVNSLFTRSVVCATWPRLADVVKIDVVYPCVDTDPDPAPEDWVRPIASLGNLVLSINRFERKKDIALAVRAFAAIPASERARVRLVLAGGHDRRVPENKQYHAELQSLAESLGLTHHTVTNPDSAAALTSALSSSSSSQKTQPPQVLFLLSIPNGLKAALLASALLVVYTPTNEHFGIVPLEAMLAACPVLAADSGGPVETVRDGVTGWLRDPNDVPAWSSAMRDALSLSEARRASMGASAASHVRASFGRDVMARRLDDILLSLKPVVAKRSTSSARLSSPVNLCLLLMFFLFGTVLSAACVSLTRG
ncbi:hypothetical protein CP532_2860 [Ophiocordyceps camponoti-leonardi (nom. inval.)]|nr:hypothetical protein CP532_2860 [Ophiocordyceps camponoti-leonardi (nom. inval.)]